MTKETVLSFLLALIVVGGSLYAFAKYGGFGPASQPAQTTGPGESIPLSRTTDPCPGGKMLQGECHVPAPGQPGVWIRLSDLNRPQVHPEATMNVAPGGITPHERQRLADFDAQQRVADAERGAQLAQQAAQAANDKELCGRIEDEIRSIDAITRHPLSPAVQDIYRKKRQALRDQQFNMHC